MSIDASHVLSRAQSAALALMVDAVIVKRLNPATTTTNTDTGVITAAYTTIYTGPCKIQQRSGIARPATVGEAEVFVSRLELHVPVTVTGILSDDVATVTASVHDPDLVGRSFHVRELAHKTLASARRYSIVEVTS